MESSEWDDFARHSPPDERVIRLRALNDRFREKFIGGQVLITTGIEALGLLATTDILDRVRGFYRDEAAFDPHDEHDFGGFEWGGETVFWKIDYYALDMLHGSPDPCDADVTKRVLTIMLASEY